MQATETDQDHADDMGLEVSLLSFYANPRNSTHKYLLTKDLTKHHSYSVNSGLRADVSYGTY